MNGSRIMLCGLLCVTTQVTAESLRIDAEAAVERVLAVSSVDAAAAARVAQAEAAGEAAWAQRKPQLSLGAQVSYRSSVPELRAPIGGPGTEPVVLFPDLRKTAAAGLTLEQALYTGGALTAAHRAALSEEERATAERGALRSTLALQARLAYWRAVEARASLVAARAQEARAQRLVTDLESLREAGMATEAEQLKAAARLAAARLALLEGETASMNARAALCSLLQCAAHEELVLADDPVRALPVPPPSLEQLVETARSERQELEALDDAKKVLSQREVATRASRRPMVAALAQWDLARPNSRYLPLEDRWDDSWAVALQASWKLFDGGRTKAQVRELQHRRRILAEEYDESERQIVLEVEQARNRLLTALAAVEVAEEGLEASRAAERAEQERLDAGMATAYELVDAQTELAQAEVATATARTGAWMAAALVERAVGR